MTLSIRSILFLEEIFYQNIFVFLFSCEVSEDFLVIPRIVQLFSSRMKNKTKRIRSDNQKGKSDIQKLFSFMCKNCYFAWHTHIFLHSCHGHFFPKLGLQRLSFLKERKIMTFSIFFVLRTEEKANDTLKEPQRKQKGKKVHLLSRKSGISHTQKTPTRKGK